MKIAGIILIIFSGAGIGLSKSRELRERIRLLEKLEQMLLLLKGEIRCTGASLEDAFLDTAQKMSGEYKVYLQDIGKRLHERPGIPFGEIFSECTWKNIPLQKLEREESTAFLSLGDKLGYLDRQMQVAQLTLLEEDLDRRIRLLKEELPGKQKLYGSMGILGGIFLAILLW